MYCSKWKKTQQKSSYIGDEFSLKFLSSTKCNTFRIYRKRERERERKRDGEREREIVCNFEAT